MPIPGGSAAASGSPRAWSRSSPAIRWLRSATPPAAETVRAVVELGRARHGDGGPIRRRHPARSLRRRRQRHGVDDAQCTSCRCRRPVPGVDVCRRSGGGRSGATRPGSSRCESSADNTRCTSRSPSSSRCRLLTRCRRGVGGRPPTMDVTAQRIELSQPRLSPGPIRGSRPGRQPRGRRRPVLVVRAGLSSGVSWRATTGRPVSRSRWPRPRSSWATTPPTCGSSARRNRRSRPARCSSRRSRACTRLDTRSPVAHGGQSDLDRGRAALEDARRARSAARSPGCSGNG